MAKSQPVTEQTLKKLDEQLACIATICLDTFKDPKLLQYTSLHVNCKGYLSNWLSQTDRDN